MLEAKQIEHYMKPTFLLFKQEVIRSDHAMINDLRKETRRVESSVSVPTTKICRGGSNEVLVRTANEYSLEPPNEYPQSMFCAEIWEVSENFHFFFGGKIFSIFE